MPVYRVSCACCSYCAQFELTDVHSTCRKMAKTSEWLSKMVRGSKLCVECQSFAMQKELGGRCRGHGVLNRQTQWKAVTVPGCHGKWKLVTSHTEQCDCDPTSAFSFALVWTGGSVPQSHRASRRPCCSLSFNVPLKNDGRSKCTLPTTSHLRWCDLIIADCESQTVLFGTAERHPTTRHRLFVYANIIWNEHSFQVGRGVFESRYIQFGSPIRNNKC